MVHRRPITSMMKPLNNLPGMLAANTSELNPKLKATAAPWLTSAFGSRIAIR